MQTGVPLLGMCPGGEEAVLKTVGLNGLAGSNPVHSVHLIVGDVNMATKRSASDLSANQLVNYNKLGTISKSLVQFDYAVDGPGIVHDPSVRIMTGATTAAHATEQNSAITAAGGMNTLKGKVIAETGNQLGK